MNTTALRENDTSYSCLYTERKRNLPPQTLGINLVSMHLNLQLLVHPSHRKVSHVCFPESIQG